LSFTPAAGASGTATVTVQAKDTGGTEGGGADTSAPQTFAITITPATTGTAIDLPSTTGDDVYEFRLDGGQLSIFSGAGIAASMLYQLPTTAISGITFDGGAGNDQIILTGSTAADDFQIGAASMSIAGVPVTYANVEQLSFDGRGGGDNLNLTAGAGRVMLTADQMLGSLNIAAGASLDVRDRTLLIDYTGATPMGVWNGSAYTGVMGLLQSGSNGGAWDGSGLVTSMSAATNGNTLTTLAVGEAGDLLGISGNETALWNGQAVDATTIIVKYTYAGDTNLDGAITGDDYFAIDSAFPQGLHGWQNGDFNYDGVINGDDYFLIDGNFPAQGLPL
jgi:hypothetical protein